MTGWRLKFVTFLMRLLQVDQVRAAQNLNENNTQDKHLLLSTQHLPDHGLNLLLPDLSLLLPGQSRFRRQCLHVVDRLQQVKLWFRNLLCRGLHLQVADVGQQGDQNVDNVGPDVGGHVRLDVDADRHDVTDVVVTDRDGSGEEGGGDHGQRCEQDESLHGWVEEVQVTSGDGKFGMIGSLKSSSYLKESVE